jgi:hypothetical protein
MMVADSPDVEEASGLAFTLAPAKSALQIEHFGSDGVIGV